MARRQCSKVGTARRSYPRSRCPLFTTWLRWHSAEDTGVHMNHSNPSTHAAHAVEAEQRAQLQASGEVTAQGRFEILAISAGQGNGWTFCEACLRDSLALWDQVETFVDHAGWVSA